MNRSHSRWKIFNLCSGSDLRDYPLYLISRRFIYERSATNIRDWSLAYSFKCKDTGNRYIYTLTYTYSEQMEGYRWTNWSKSNYLHHYCSFNKHSDKSIRVNFLPFKEVMSYRPTNRPTTTHDKLADKLVLLFVVPLKSNLSSLVGKRRRYASLLTDYLTYF